MKNLKNFIRVTLIGAAAAALLAGFGGVASAASGTVHFLGIGQDEMSADYSLSENVLNFEYQYDETCVAAGAIQDLSPFDPDYNASLALAGYIVQVRQDYICSSN